MSAPLRRLRVGVAGLLLFVLAGSGTACAPGGEAPGWHPVTAEESQLLAVARFRNVDLGSREFDVSVTVQGQDLEIGGWYDFPLGQGYAEVTGQGFAPQAMIWDETAVAVRAQDPGARNAAGTALPAWPLPEPAAEGWNSRPVDPAASALDALLLIVSHLGADRPDNPLLLQQSGALWLGTEHAADGTTLQVFAGPPSDQPLSAADPLPTPDAATVRFALDDTGTMHWSEVLMNGRWVRIELGAEGPALDDVAEVLRIVTGSLGR